MLKVFREKRDSLKWILWLLIVVLGAGMVHPRLFEKVGYDSRRYTGFAWGMGIDRLALLKYQIHDMRLFFENDLRFLQQF